MSNMQAVLRDIHSRLIGLVMACCRNIHPTTTNTMSVINTDPQEKTL